MGNFTSKVGEEIPTEEPSEGSVPSTPILTPKVRTVHLDPRSPSTNVIRTPIEVLFTSDTKSSADVSGPLCNEDIIETPGNVETQTQPLKLHNKNLDNVRKSLISYTPTTKIYNGKCNSEGLPKKLLDGRRKSYVGLLETNLDYVETDLDTVKRDENRFDDQQIIIKEDSCRINEDTEFSTPNKSDITHDYYEAIDPRSPTIDFIRTPVLLIKKIEEINLNDDKGECVTCPDGDDERSNKPADMNITPQTNNIHSDDDVARKVLSTAKQNIRDFDKKLTDLIYEDKDVAAVIKSNSIKAGRIPLSVRNLNANKAVPKLRVRDKPRKIEKDVSKIPIFKDKKMKSKLNQQCENTPPSNLVELQNDNVKKSQWDHDSTLII